MDKDQLSTLAGGSAGLWLLSTVKWEAVPYGETYKVGVALVLIVAGYLFYSGDKPKNV